MVLKLVSEGNLASQPFDKSEVARKLLALAVDMCWPKLTRFLLGVGTPVDQGVSPASVSLKWPAPSQAFTYAFPSGYLDNLPSSYFDAREVLSDIEKLHLEYPKQISTFVQLVESSKFRDLATSLKSEEHSDCQEMMNILRDSGADPLLTNRDGNDALSYLVVMRCSTDVLRHLIQLWRGAIARKAETEGNHKAVSPALYKAISTTIPDLGTVRTLLDAGVSPESENEGLTPLFMAAYMNIKMDAMGLLLEFGANPDNGGEKGYPPLVRTLQAPLIPFELLIWFEALTRTISIENREPSHVVTSSHLANMNLCEQHPSRPSVCS
jgi:hypothetical protein